MRRRTELGKGSGQRDRAPARVLFAVAEELHSTTRAMAFAGFHVLVEIASALVLVAVLSGGWMRRTIDVLAPIGWPRKGCTYGAA